MLTAIVRFKILEQAHGQSPFRFTVADLDRPVRAKRLDGREILPVYWRLSKERKPGTAGAASFITLFGGQRRKPGETGGQAVLWSYVNII